MSKRKSGLFSSYALEQLFGKKNKYKTVLYLLLIMVSISWIGDTLLVLFLEGAKFLTRCFQIENLELIFNLLIFFLALSFIFIVVYKASKKTYSSPYTISDVDPLRKTREVLIMPLSNFNWVANRDSSLAEFVESIKSQPLPDSIKGFKESNFNCNWVPTLNAITYYPNVKRVILLTTSGDGSYKEFDEFKTFAHAFLKDRSHKIDIENFSGSGLLQDYELKKHVNFGVPADSAKLFSEVILEILDNLEHENKSNSDYLAQKLVIDITGGKASMSSSLAAVSGQQGIFLHYTDTHTMESHVLDVNAQ